MVVGKIESRRATPSTVWRKLRDAAEPFLLKLEYYLTAPAERLDARFGHLRASLIIGLMVVAISFFMYSSALWMRTPGRFDDFIRLCINPLSRALNEPMLAYRITTPLIAYLLWLRGPQAGILQFIANIATFSLIYLLMRRRVGVSTAFLSCLGLAQTQVAQVSNTWLGYPDSVTNLALAAAMWTPSPLVIVCISVAGMLNDERFLVGAPLVVLWHFISAPEREGKKRAFKAGYGIAIASGIVLIVRMALSRGWIGEGIPPDAYQRNWVGFSFATNYKLSGILFGFRWMWLIPLAACLLYLKDKMELKCFALLCGLLAVCASSLLVGDISRSIAVGFPGILCAIILLRERNARFCKRLLTIAVVLCLLTPHFNVVGANLQWLRPLPFSLLRWMRS